MQKSEINGAVKKRRRRKIGKCKVWGQKRKKEEKENKYNVCILLRMLTE